MRDEQVLIAIPGASKRRDAGQSVGVMGFRLYEEEMDYGVTCGNKTARIWEVLSTPQ